MATRICRTPSSKYGSGWPLGPRRSRYRRAAQNHYVAIAAEICAHHGRLDDAVRCADTARAICAEFPGGFNEVHSRWADAVVADARGDADALTKLAQAAETARRRHYVAGECKAWSRLAERQAAARDFEAAHASLLGNTRVPWQACRPGPGAILRR